MRIGVVGGGAIGLLTAGYLSLHFPVTLYVRRDEQKSRLLSEGLTIEEGLGHLTNFNIKKSSQDWTEELIILTVKQPDLPGLLKNHPKAETPGQSLLFLQNGAAHLSQLESLDYENIFIGFVEHGAWKKSDTTVVQRGLGQIKVGMVHGNIKTIEPLLTNTAFPFSIIPNWERALDEKLLINSVINPLTSLYRVTNGELYRNPHYFQAMKGVFQEAVTVLNLEDHNKEWDRLLQVCRNTWANRSSMLQDIEAGQKTEIEAILGVIIKRAEEQALNVPIIHFLYESIKGMEEKKRVQKP